MDDPSGDRADAPRRLGSTRALSDRLDELEPDLIENGLAFLHRAVMQVANSEKDLRNLSFSVVDLAVAVEVLLKARLVREHWTLICLETDRANPADMRGGRLRTIAPEAAMKRLGGTCGVDLAQSNRRSQVDALLRLRNRAVHFTLAGESPVGVQAALGQALDFAFWFLGQEFLIGAPTTVEEAVRSTMDAVRGELGKIEDLVAARLITIAADLDSAELVVACPRCRQAALLLLPGETSKCAFCMWAPLDGNECALEYIESVLDISVYRSIKEGDEPPLYVCPECGEDALVRGIVQGIHTAGSPTTKAKEASVSTSWGCFACGFVANEHDLDFCNRCGDPTRVTDPTAIPVCETCWGELLGRD